MKKNKDGGAGALEIVQMKIGFLIPNRTDVHYYKLISALGQLGAEAEVLAFERKYYEGKKYNYPYTFLGRIEHGHYFKRLLAILKAVPTARSRLKGLDIAYVFGRDMLLVCSLAVFGLRRKPKIVFEVYDIQPVLVGISLKSRALRWLERILIRKVCLLVVTSEAFITGYYGKIQGLINLRYLVIENKLIRGVAALPAQRQMERPDDGLRIGYFGVIRCPRSLEILKAAARDGKGRVRVYVRGIPIGEVTDIESDIKENPWVEYGGPYLSPDDLPRLYESVDIVWACYTYMGKQVGNWMWARTNRFYEACFYKKPIIAGLGTEDGRVVSEKGLGICVDVSDVRSCVEQILAIAPADLQRWRNNLDKLPEDIYLYTDEHQQLMDILSRMHSSQAVQEE